MSTPQVEPRPLRVTRLAVSNFKRIVAADITAGDKTLVILRGANEQGKTSALEALISTLNGKAAAPDVPIRVGEESATVEVTLGDGRGPKYRITRSFKGDRTWLNVQQIGDDGQPAKVGAGQTLLNSLVNDLSFDPLAFAKTNDRKTQVRMLYQAAGMLPQYEAAQAKRAGLYEQRAQLNAKARQLEAELVALPDPAPGQTLQPVSDAELTAQLQDAEAHNDRRRRHQSAVESAVLAACGARRRLEDIEREAATLRAEIAQHDQTIADQKAALAQLAPAIDVAKIQAHIQQTQEHNRRCEAQARRAQSAAMLAETRAEADRLTAAMAAVDAEVDGMLETSNLGQAVPGLQVKDGQITHNGVPFSQASGMRRLELSALIGMAANPRLRIMTIDEGDQLDDASLARLKELAAQRDFAVWLTAIRAGNETDDDALIVPVEDGRAVGGASLDPPAIGRTRTATLATTGFEDL